MLQQGKKTSPYFSTGIKKLIQLKHTGPALAAYAEFIPLYVKENTYPFVYARANENDILLVILNPTAQSASAEFPINIPCKQLKVPLYPISLLYEK